VSTDLRQKLIDAQLATYPESADEHSPVAGPHWRTNEQAADAALAVFAEWLREASQGLDDLENAADIAGLFADQRYVLNGLADSITTPKEQDGG
jgi:hypothetical protein